MGSRKHCRARCGQLQDKPEDCKIKIVPERSRPPENPDKIPFLCPAPATSRAPKRKQSTGARGHASTHSPAQNGWRQKAGPAPRRRCWPCCCQARRQPISTRRQRRPAFELGTATSCCLASTQCNAVCLSALRHKGTAILWLSWTCTKMPEPPRAAPYANYGAAPLFHHQSTNGTMGRGMFWYLGFRFICFQPS